MGRRAHISHTAFAYRKPDLRVQALNQQQHTSDGPTWGTAAFDQAEATL